MLRLFLTILIVLACIQTLSAAERLFGVEGYRDTVRPFLNKYCMSCHNLEKQKGGVRYDRFPQGFAHSDRDLWTRIREKLHYQEMPPEGQPQPDAATSKAVQTWIKNQGEVALAAYGKGNVRRLNRREYAAAVQSLLRLPMDITDRFAPDAKMHGYDTVGMVLQDAAETVTVTLETLEHVTRGMVILEEPPDPEHRTEIDFTSMEKFPNRGFGSPETRLVYEYRGRASHLERNFILKRGVVLAPGKSQDDKITEGKSLGFRIDYYHDEEEPLPVRIRYEIENVSTKGMAPPMLNMRMSRSWSSSDQYFKQVNSEPGSIDTHTYVLFPDFAPRAKAIRNTDLGRQYATFEIRNGQRLPFDPYAMDKPIHYFWNQQFKDKDNEQVMGDHPGSWLILRRVIFESGYHHEMLSADERKAYGATDAGAKRFIDDFVARAFRRPPTAEELALFQAAFAKRRAAEYGLDEALVEVVKMVLLAPPTRNLDDTEHKDQERAAYALASRLSFAFWAQMPDGPLLEAAESGTIAQDLNYHVERLLSDPRAEKFHLAFAHAWLEMGLPIRIWQKQRERNSKDFVGEPSPDDLRKDEYYLLHSYTPFIVDSLRKEPGHYFGALLAENRHAREIVDSDWAMMNDTLAFHYNYPRIIGEDFKKVSLRKDDPRGGGILGMAGPMSMTTHMGDNWPIYRAAWFLNHVIDDGLPPPPLEVPSLDSNKEENAKKDLRTLLTQHTKDPSCASCHVKMDPIGYAWQNFDISGRWRKEQPLREQVVIGTRGMFYVKPSRDKSPVDARGSLPRGETFETFAEFKSIVRDNYTDDIVRGLLKRYVMYFAGRKPTADDLDEIRSIMRKMKPKGYPMRDLLKSTLQSDIFLN